MADDPKPDDKPDPKDDKPDPDAGAKKALEAERKLRRDAEAKAKDLEVQLAKISDDQKTATDKDKSEAQKLTEQMAKLQTDLDGERLLRLKAEVAADKGLTPAQAKRLSGSSKEDLEADADDLLEAFPAPSKDEAKDDRRSGPPSRRPAAELKGGSEPEDKPVDVKSIVDSIPPTA